MADNETLTLMAVHAHPDDESSSTGGVLARYSGRELERWHYQRPFEIIAMTCAGTCSGRHPSTVPPLLSRRRMRSSSRSAAAPSSCTSFLKIRFGQV